MRNELKKRIIEALENNIILIYSVEHYRPDAFDDDIAEIHNLINEIKEEPNDEEEKLS